ncbi:MAG TPA: hypothetical protein VKB67_04820 [Rhizomicrobium sp.]|nr:hypothetical protein [Rhizomicrobium sp.]
MAHLSPIAPAVTCALLATNSGAAADATTNDVHCYIVYMQMGSSKEPGVQSAGIMGTLYFMGKLDGRNPDLDLENAILTEIPKLRGGVFNDEAARCQSELQARGQAETAMGKDMQQRAAKMQQEQNSH